jgi:hypothetical protein
VRKGTQPIIIEREGGSSLWWFVLGGALGAGLALLFAPHSGDRTRQLVGRKLSKLRDAADVALEDLREALTPEDRVHRSLAESEEAQEEGGEGDGRSGLDRAGAEAPERAAAPRRKASGGAAAARHELEQRLAAARARRHRSLADEDEEPVA